MNEAEYIHVTNKTALSNALHCLGNVMYLDDEKQEGGLRAATELIANLLQDSFDTMPDLEELTKSEERIRELEAKIAEFIDVEAHGEPYPPV